VQGLAYNAPLVYFNRGSEIRIVTAATADWSHSAIDGNENNPATFDSFVLSGNTIFTGAGQGSSASASRYFAFDAKTGKLLWRHDGSQSSVPCVASNTVYVGFGALGSGDSYVLNASNGAVRRVIKHIGTAQWHAAGSVVYASILSGGGSRLRASIRAYDQAGNTLWVAHDILFGAALPTMLFGITSGAIDARSARDGHRLWKSKVPDFESVDIGSMVVSGGLVFVQSTDGRINVLDRDTGHLLRTIVPPFKAAIAGNLIVGAGMLFESLSRSTSGGTATLVGFGA
jgi:outer membrane protein assembly factor BamB